MLASEVIACARGYIGTSYLHQGRTKYGLDCVGLIIRVAQDLGLSRFDISHYGRVPSGNMMKRLLAQNCQPVLLNQIVDADIIHLAFYKQPQHLAFIAGENIIHADAIRGVVEHRLDSVWRKKIRAAYRLPGVESGAISL